MKVLFDLRPALSGHAGIPQETRLLFRGLAASPGVEVIGLIQSSNQAIDAGLPLHAGQQATGVSDAQAIDILSGVVASLQPETRPLQMRSLRRRFMKFAGPLAAGAGALVGRKVSLWGFDAAHFKSFLWHAAFAKSLPEADSELVTSRDFRVLRWPWSMLHAVGVLTRKLGYAVYPRLDTTGMDVLLVETPFPGRMSGGTRMVVRYHDAIPLLMPHTVKHRMYHRAAHLGALRRNARDGAWFACVSEATRQNLLAVMPELVARSVTIPNMVSHHYFPETAPATRVPQIILRCKNRQVPHGGGAAVPPSDLAGASMQYLLMVSTIEPRKDHLALLGAWELLRAAGNDRLHLVLVGSLGWEHAAILRRLAPWLKCGGLHMLEWVPADDLRLLYRHARVTVCPSLGEGFDFPGIEAMRCGGVVAASDIAVHHEIFDDAAEYFTPHSTTEMTAALQRLLGDAGRQEALRLRGAEVAARYLPARILPQWQAFLASLAQG